MGSTRRTSGPASRPRRSSPISSENCRSSRPATPRNSAARRAASSASSPRAARTSSTARSAAYFNSEALNGDLALNNTAGTAGGSALGSGLAQLAPGTTGVRRALRLVLSGANEAETVLYPKDDYTRWDPHFQVGGPIVRDKLWFWAGYTPQLENTDRIVTFNSTGATGAFSSTETTQNMVGNVTWQVSDAWRLRVSGQNRPFEQDGRLPNVDGTSNPATQFASLGIEQDNITTTGSVDWVASNRVFLNAKVNYLRYDTRDLGIPNEIWYNFEQGSNLDFETRPELRREAGFNTVLTNSARIKDLTRASALRRTRRST